MKILTVMTPTETDMIGLFKYYFCLYDIDAQVSGHNSKQNRVYISPLYENYGSCRNAAAAKRNELHNS